MSRRPKLHAAGMALALIGASLAGCGGGDGGGSLEAQRAERAEHVPASVGASTAAFFTFALNASPSETADALQLDLIPVAPTSETDEPFPLT